MSKETSYLVPAETVSIEQVIKRSRFIATVGRATDKEKAKSFIEGVCKTYPDATHNCYAFVAGNPFSSAYIGMSDDGELQGTAGKPMLSVLQHKKIGEIAAIVTRYFGGIKLGPGGLVRAYTSSLQLALDKLSLEECVSLVKAQIEFTYNHENSIRQILIKMNVSIINSTYTDNVVMNLQVPENISDELSEEIMNQTSGKVKVNWSSE